MYFRSIFKYVPFGSPGFGDGWCSRTSIAWHGPILPCFLKQISGRRSCRSEQLVYVSQLIRVGRRRTAQDDTLHKRALLSWCRCGVQHMFPNPTMPLINHLSHKVMTISHLEWEAPQGRGAEGKSETWTGKQIWTGFYLFLSLSMEHCPSVCLWGNVVIASIRSLLPHWA